MPSLLIAIYPYSGFIAIIVLASAAYGVYRFLKRKQADNKKFFIIGAFLLGLANACIIARVESQYGGYLLCIVYYLIFSLFSYAVYTFIRLLPKPLCKILTFLAFSALCAELGLYANYAYSNIAYQPVCQKYLPQNVSLELDAASDPDFWERVLNLPARSQRACIAWDRYKKLHPSVQEFPEFEDIEKFNGQK